MNYIINPGWFYWISVIDALKMFFVAFVIVSAGAFIASSIISFLTFNDCRKDDEEYVFAKKIRNYSGIFLVVFSLALVFIPSRDTLIEMQIARYATYENAEWTVDAIKGAVDYIVSAIKSMK